MPTTSPISVLDKKINEVINDNVLPFVEKNVVPRIKSGIKAGMQNMPSVPNVKPMIADSMFVQYAKPVAKRSWKISGQAIDFIAARSPKYLGEQMEAAFGSAKTWFDANVIEIERTPAVKPAAVKTVTVKQAKAKPTAAKKTIMAKPAVNKTATTKPAAKKTVTAKPAASKSAAAKARKVAKAAQFDPYNA
jgi:hypothetical protein